MLLQRVTDFKAEEILDISDGEVNVTTTGEVNAKVHLMTSAVEVK